MKGSLPVLLLVVSATMAGCTSSPGEDGAEAVDPVLITDPSQNRTTADMRPHLHNYWKGQERLTVIEEDIVAQGYFWLGGGQLIAATFRPAEGDVVPQGAAWVNVTLTWDNEGDTNAYQDPELWVKSAQDDEPVFLTDLDGPDSATVAIPTTNAMNDLPHQVLSAWQFELRILDSGTPPVLPRGQFDAVVHILVTTDLGLEIPIYPGHPDRWAGQTEIELFDATATVRYDGDPTTTNWRSYGAPPIIHTPDEGVVVPYDAEYVIVVLDVTYGAPSRLGLKVHAADSREWVALDPSDESENVRTYEIPVEAGGDGPYALQSQWEFAPWVEGPVENGFIMEEYRITATVYK